MTTNISPDHSPVNLPVKKGEISSPLTAQECKSDNQSLELLKKTYLIICYNKEWKIPLWVGYELTKPQIEGNVRRTNDFRPDPALNDQFTANLKDYKGSGFDRGHMAPAAAFKADQVGMSGTFLLSNIAPQTPALNRIAWRQLEAEVRTLVHDSVRVWVFTGNVVPPTTDENKIRIIGDRVFVPSHNFKAILVTDAVTGQAYASYGLSAPNLFGSLSKSTRAFATSIDVIEEQTGIDFFAYLEDLVEDRLESSQPIWPPIVVGSKKN